MNDERKLKLAFNPNLIDKNISGDSSLYSKGWANIEVTLPEIAGGIQHGWAYCPQMSGPRSAKNFLACDVASVDIDDAPSVESVLLNLFVSQHAGLIYTTPSHTEERPRLRVVFVLPRTITDPKEMATINRALTLRLGGDPAATDAARISFGSRGATIFKIGREVPVNLLEELILHGRQVTNKPQGQKATNTASDGLQSARSDLPVPSDLILKVAGGETRALSETKPKTRVHCPFHSDESPSAFVVASQQGVHGIHCSTCAQTFWPKPERFDFDHFEKVAREAASYFEKHEDGGVLFPNPDAIKGLQACHVNIVKGSPAPSELQPGITFVKSPKGSGKTTSLISLLSDESSVLLIGHRRALIEQSCEKLNLEYYLDCDEESDGITDARLGVCLDSLHKVSPKCRYNVLVLDEFEQILSHFLSDTLKNRRGGGRDRLFVEFRQRVRDAKYVIALDADLGWITFSTLSQMVSTKEAAR